MMGHVEQNQVGSNVLEGIFCTSEISWSKMDMWLELTSCFSCQTLYVYSTNRMPFSYSAHVHLYNSNKKIKVSM